MEEDPDRDPEEYDEPSLASDPVKSKLQALVADVGAASATCRKCGRLAVTGERNAHITKMQACI